MRYPAAGENGQMGDRPAKRVCRSPFGALRAFGKEFAKGKARVAGGAHFLSHS